MRNKTARAFFTAALALSLAFSDSTAEAGFHQFEFEELLWQETNHQSVWQQDVPEATKWNKFSLEQSSIALGNAKERLVEEFQKLRKQGAYRIRVDRHITLGRLDKSWKPYFKDLRAFELVGLDKSGRAIARSALIPSAKVTVATRLVQPATEVCTVADFAIFDVDTWFATKCELAAVSPAQYLRAAVREEHLTRTSKVLGGQLYEGQKTAWVCGSGRLKYTVTKTRFVCPEAVFAYSQTSFQLKYVNGLGGYKLDMNPKTLETKLTYLPPDYAIFAVGVKARKNSPNLTFLPNEVGVG